MGNRLELTLQSMKTLSELMDRALELDGEARTRWLDELATGPHAPLHPLLRELLAKQADISTTFLSSPASVGGASAAAGLVGQSLEPGAHVGPYVLDRPIGQGGMGTVWLAHRDDGTLKREVALKLPLGHRSGVLAERFARERDILASLTHPNIARLYDAGFSADGQPYLALEYIEGKPITAYCDALQLGVRDRLQCFLQVADALQYAHGNLVIHRDLKPANILVSDDRRVHLLDFGIAKLLDEPLAHGSDSELTVVSGRALTLDYASPEQIQGAVVGTASDVYSMAVVLFQLLTGQKPYALKRGTRAELEEAIVSAEPARMSDVVRRTSGGERLARTLAGDLDTIVAHAMRKNPQQRYTTATAFADDIRRYLNGRPVQARPDSWGYRAGKFIARNWLPVGAGAAVLVALVGGFAAAMWQADVARSEAGRADREAVAARAEKSRADAEAARARNESRRADDEARAARAEAARADTEAAAALQAARRASAAATAASQAATRADREATTATRETQRATSVHGFMVDLFAANSNDQKNAVEVRKLTAKQLLDRGTARLEAAGTGDASVDDSLYALFGKLYENLADYETSKRLREKTIERAAQRHGKQSVEYANAILDLAWVEAHDIAGKRMDLVREAKAIMQKHAAESPALARAWVIEARTVDRARPQEKLAAAKEALRILQQHPIQHRLRADAETALALAERELGNYEAGLAALQRSAAQYAQLYGEDSLEYAQALGGIGMTQRGLLRLTDAERSLARAVELLRPYHRYPVEATVFGRGLQLARAARGDLDGAASTLEAAHSAVTGSEPAAANMRSGISGALASIASGRGDTRRALQFSQRALAERDGRQSNLIAADAVSLASTAVAAREFDIADAALATAYRIRDEKGLPSHTAMSLTRVAAELAARRAAAKSSSAGDGGAAGALSGSVDSISLAAVESRNEEGLTPMTRLTGDVRRARAAAARREWEAVQQLCTSWLRPDSGYELPVHYRADLLLLLGEAELRLGRDSATATLRAALDIMERHFVSSSRSLAWGRQLLAGRKVEQ